MTNFGTEWPPTSADVKQYLNIDLDNSERDSLLLLAGDSARARVERYCQRQFLTATRTYYLNGDRTVLLPVPDWPITSVTSIHIDTEFPRSWDAADLVDSDNYRILNDSATMDDELKHSIHLIDGGVWSEGKQNIRVIAVTGYTEGSIPDELYFATMELTAHIFMRAENKRIGLTNRSEQGGSVGYDLERAAIPLAIRDALDPFKATAAFGY